MRLQRARYDFSDWTTTREKHIFKGTWEREIRGERKIQKNLVSWEPRHKMFQRKVIVNQVFWAKYKVNPLELATWEVIAKVSENYLCRETGIQFRHQWFIEKMVLPHDSSDFECNFRPLQWPRFLKDLLSYVIQRAVCDNHYKDTGIRLSGVTWKIHKFCIEEATKISTGKKK